MKTHQLIFMFLFLMSAAAAVANPQDSIGVKKVNGKVYVLHKVTSGETLFGLQRKYSVAVNDIKSANDGLAGGLKVGETVMIPRSYSLNTSPAETNTAAAAASAGSHTVAKGETLNSIAKKYNVTVAQIQEANGISDANIKIGQVLSIPSGKASQTAAISSKPQESRPVTSTQVKTTPANNGAESPKMPEGATPVDEQPVSKFEPQYEGVEVNETGKAKVSSDNPLLDPNRNFVLHAKARAGTILMITNTTTNEAVFARVVGNFKQTEDNKNVVVVMNSTMSERLGGSSDIPFNVKVNYAK